MSVPTKKVASELVLCLIFPALTLALQCGPAVGVVHHYSLPTCPREAFALPDSVRRTPYVLSNADDSKEAEGYAPCPGLKVYHLVENGSERLYYYVRLNRGTYCTLDVGYGYIGGQSEYIERRTTPWVKAVAELVLDASGVTPSVPATKVDRLESDEERNQWCAE